MCLYFSFGFPSSRAPSRSSITPYSSHAGLYNALINNPHIYSQAVPRVPGRQISLPIRCCFAGWRGCSQLETRQPGGYPQRTFVDSTQLVQPLYIICLATTTWAPARLLPTPAVHVHLLRLFLFFLNHLPVCQYISNYIH